MKSKKAAYILLPLVVIIWGVVLYRIFGFIHHEDVPVISQSNILLKGTETKRKQSNFHLVANYRDPFLGNVAVQERKSINPKTIPVSPVKVTWPRVVYGGMIKNKKTTKLVGIVQVNGKDNLLKETDTIAGMKVLQILRDSLLVEYHNEKKFVYK